MALFVQSLVKQEKTLVGSYLGPKNYYSEMLQFSADHNIHPKVEVLGVSEINTAVDRVRRNQARYRVVLQMDDVRL